MMFFFLVLDKSTSGWFPKTSKLGGIPNFTHKARTLVTLGAILKNYAECNKGTIFCNEIVQNPEQQSRKNYSKDKISFPGESNVELMHKKF